MKKSLIALAALSAITGSAVAQSSVTVYGVLDVGYSESDKTISGTKTTQNAMTFNNFASSRFGVKGSEDLGGGTKAAFTIESGIGSNILAGFGQTNASAYTKNGTTIDATSLGNRELNAVLDFSTGTSLKAGYGSTAVRDIILGNDAAFAANVAGNVLANDARLGSNRATVAQVSQKFGAFTASAALATNADKSATETTAKSNGTTLALAYAQGKAKFAVATQENKTKSAAVGVNTTTFVVGSSATACPTGYTDSGVDVSVSTNGGATVTARALCSVSAVAAVDKTEKINVAGGSYDFGVAQVFASYADIKTNDEVAVDVVGEGKRSAYSVGLRAPVGKFTPFVQYSSGSKNEVITAGTAAVKRDWAGYTVGSTYNMSKRTAGYLVMGQTKLDGTSGVTNEVKVDQVTVGLVHSF
jgi:predicted porin